uniref:Uncharacterized protein n=1 Tax=Oryza brachyantha TaxID=4533 RepID=J3LTK7_ORYBR
MPLQFRRPPPSPRRSQVSRTSSVAIHEWPPPIGPPRPGMARAPLPPRPGIRRHQCSGTEMQPPPGHWQTGQKLQR